MRIDGEWLFDVADIAVVPGTRDSVAVVVRNCCGPECVAVYDDGVRRPEICRQYPIPSALDFDGPSTLYGVAGWDTFLHMAIDASGVHLVAAHEDAGAYYRLDSRMIGGHLYSDVATIFDPRAAERVGRIPRGPVEALPERNPFACTARSAPT